MCNAFLKYLFICHISFERNLRIQNYSIFKRTIIRAKKFHTITKEKSRILNGFHRYNEIMNVPKGIFKGVEDRFNGIVIDSAQEYDKQNDFAEKLERSLNFWKNKFRGVWFKIYTENADWVSPLAKQGFNFHHAKKGYVMMYKWLPINESENIPVYAHTIVGVGGLVINKKNEVLAVSDRYTLIPDSWKLPGGYVEPNENLVNAAIREVEEETGIIAEFDTLLSIRHSSGGSFGCSDIYVVIALIPKSEVIRHCEREIAKCEWIPIHEFLNHPNVHETSREFVNTYLMYKKCGLKINCETKIHQILKKQYVLYTAEMSGNVSTK